MSNNINAYHWNENKPVTLIEIASKNGAEKLKSLWDEELKILKQEAVEKERYHIAILIKKEQNHREYEHSQAASNRETSQGNTKNDLLWIMTPPVLPAIPWSWWLSCRHKRGGWGEVIGENWEIVATIPYEKVEFRHDWFIAASNDWVNRDLLNRDGKILVEWWTNPEYQFKWWDRMLDKKVRKEWYAYIFNNETRKWERINQNWDHFDFDTMEKISG